jgi:predicted NBD/HSP70 family sugar kinase
MIKEITPSSSSGSAGELFQLIRSGRARTLTDLVLLTGFARSTVFQRTELLLKKKLIVKSSEGVSTGGRPPVVFSFNATAGVALIADLGATHSRLAVVDLSGTPLAELRDDLNIADGPDAVLRWVIERFEEMLAQLKRTKADVWGVGVGVPGPVEFAAGRTVSPPIMPGWDGVPIASPLQAHFSAPVLIDNDVNLMALGEHSANWPQERDVLFIKVGTGIGCGIISEGRLHRGAQGAAGDIGHIRVATEETLCHCGNAGCLEAVASGGAIALKLSENGFETHHSRDVVALVRAGNPQAVQEVRKAGRLIGEVLAAGVNFFNPSVIVVGGDMAEVDQPLLAGIREVIYQRSPPLATRYLQIVRSTLGDRAGIIGGANMVLETVLAPSAIDRLLEPDSGSLRVSA